MNLTNRLQNLCAIALLAGTMVLSACQEPAPEASANTAQVRYQRALTEQTSALASASRVAPLAPGVNSATGELAQWALWRIQQPDHPDVQPLLVAASALFERLDPVWGGLLERLPEEVPADTGDLLATRLETQSLALTVFASSYWVSGEQRFRNAFAKVDGYVQDWLRSRDGGYSRGQLLQPPSLRASVTAADYWRLRREHDRRQLGIPLLAQPASNAPVAKLALAYWLAADAFADNNYGAEALRLTEQLAPDSMMLASANACSELPDLLALLLTSYGRSADPLLLERARATAEAIFAQQFEDPLCQQAQLSESQRATNLATLAVGLQTLGVITRERALAPTVAALLRASTAQWAVLEPSAKLAVARRSQWLTNGFSSLAIAGQWTDPRTKQLTAAARSAWVPGKIIHPVAQGNAAEQQLPRMPAIYVCNAAVCQSPVTTPDALKPALATLPSAAQILVADQLSHFLGDSQALEH